jgi:hypothetical protein
VCVCECVIKRSVEQLAREHTSVCERVSKWPVEQRAGVRMQNARVISAGDIAREGTRKRAMTIAVVMLGCRGAEQQKVTQAKTYQC